jgi:hypothetical protein
MKNLKSLQLVALAGVAAALTGCSSTGYSENESSDRSVAYQWVSSSGFTPITDVRYLGMFPREWTPVSYETYTMAVPTGDADASASINTASSSQSIENIEPGDTFVEAAGADSDGGGEVRRVILYSPFRNGPVMSR